MTVRRPSDARLLSLVRTLWRERSRVAAIADIADAQLNRECDRIRQLESQIAALPACTPLGAAAKLRMALWPDFVLDRGELDLSGKELGSSERMLIEVLMDLEAMSAPAP